MLAAVPSLPLPRLQIKGAVQEGALYITRAADAELEHALLAGQYCYVLAPRQIGKSSLRLHVARALTARGVRCVHIDLTLVGGHDDREPRRGWYFSLLSLIATQLGLADPLPFWQRCGDALPVFHFGRYLREQALAQVAGPVVIFIDELDYLKSLPFDSDEFIDAIRAYYNARGEDPAYQRLTFCLLGVAAPAELIRNAQITPFNIGRPIVVEDFVPAELAGFAPLLAALGGDPEIWLAEVFRWTAGHPYMTQALCDRLRSERGAEAQGPPASRVEQAVRTLFVRRGRIADPNLSYAEKRLDSQADSLRKAELLALYRRLLLERAVPIKDGDPVQLELQLCGMAAQREDATGARRLHPRNEIFTRVFDLTWVREKETQRQLTQALQRWQEGGRRPEVLLRGAELAAAQAWADEHAGELTQAEHEFLRACLDGARRAAEEQRLLSEARNQRRTVIGLAVVVVLLLGLAVGLYRQYLRAEQAAKQAAASRNSAVLLARAESEAKKNAQAEKERALQSAAAERMATREAQRQAERAEAAVNEEQRARKAAQQAAFSAQQARRQAEAAQARAEREAARATQEAARAEREKNRAEQATQQALSSARTEKSLRAAAIAAQPGNQLQALLAGMQAAEPERRTGLGPQWEGANRAMEESTLATLLRGHSGGVNSVAFSPDGRRIVTASSDRTAQLRDSQSGRTLLFLKGHSDSVSSAAFSPDGRRIVTASNDGTARLWDTQLGRVLLSLTGHSGSVYSAAFSPDGRRIVTASSDRTARLWDPQAGRALVSLKGHMGSVLSAAFSPDGQRIVTSSIDLTARLWDAQSGRALLSLKGHANWVRSATFSPDGQRIVTSSIDRTARVWDAQSGRALLSIKGPPGFVFSAAFSPDGQRIVTSSDDVTARLWDAQSGRELLSFKDHSDWARFAAFSPDGQRIVTSSDKRTARLWDAQSGRALVSLKGHSGSVNSAVFSPDGRRIVTASTDGTARLWDAQSGRELLSLTGHSGSVNSAAFSPDGRRIVTASDDGTAVVHPIDPEVIYAFDCKLLRNLRGLPEAPADEVDAILATCPN